MMNGKRKITMGLAIAGTVLVWIPLVSPVFFGAMAWISSREWRFDYLMPAELFPVSLAGGMLLLWASLRAHHQRGLVGGSLAAAIVMLASAQAMAVVTGLASGETSPQSAWFAVVILALVAYILTLAACGVGGILLLNWMNRTKPDRST